MDYQDVTSCLPELVFSSNFLSIVVRLKALRQAMQGHAYC